jgi:hypothetical protein
MSGTLLLLTVIFNMFTIAYLPDVVSLASGDARVKQCLHDINQ